MEPEDFNYNSNELLLKSLKKYLNYQLSTFLLFAISFFSIILIILLIIVAILFIPYVIFVLFRNEKFSWIVTLLLITVIPSLVLIFSVENTHTIIMLLLIVLAIFYFYCFSLRFAVNGWVNEIETVRLINFQTEKFKEKSGDESYRI